MPQPDFAESIGLEPADTDRLYEALAALRQSEVRFRSLCELSSDWYWEQDENFRFTSRSGGTADHAALRPQEDHGKTRWELPAIGVTEAQWQAHRETLAAHLPFRDFVYQRLDDAGELRSVSVSGHPVFDDAGVFRGYRGIARDITGQVREERLLAQQRKQREEALRESEARFRSLCELSSDWYWEQDADLRFTVMSAGDGITKGNFRVDKALGRTRWELPIELSEAEWAAHKATLAARQPFTDFEYKILTEDGSMRWYSARGEPLFDEAGRFAGYRGVANDITQRKRRDEELRRFRVAMDTSADSIFLVDRSRMRYIDANATACAMLGYTREQLLAMGPQDMVGKPREEVERDFDALIAGEEERSRKQASLRRSDGTPLRVEISRRALQSGDGWIIVGIARDISDRLAAEQTIRQHAMQQSLIAAFGQKALADTPLDDLLAQAAQVAAQGLDVELCAVLQLGPDGRSLLLKAGLGWQDEWMGRRVEADPGPSELLASHAVTEAIDVPIRGVGGPYGVLGVYSRAPRHFTQENVDFLQSVANTLATAMDRKNAEQRLTYLAQFDTLTGLANRSLFLDRFAQTLKQAKRNDWLVGVLFVDLDRFKLVNDTLGHSIGDQLLVQVAQRLQECVRAGDAVGRLGGDEFAFVLSNLTRADDAALVAQKVVATLAAPFRLEGQEVYVSASLGIGIYPADGDEADMLLRNADTAMYRAKEQGRNTYQFYLPQMNEQALERLQLQTQLRGALERGEFVLHYQPKASLA
ncbi:MAG TPA: diguanylate cyclase, partial [Albitalea sp.]|nr:diguanylate cyclase [Albitalea sp.]